MTETADGPMSLQREFECSIQAINRGEKLRCFHKLIKGKQCGNKLSKATLTKLVILFKEIIELLKNGSKQVEMLLKDASLLVMCVRRHRDEAAAKFEEWSMNIPARSCRLANSGSNVESLSSTSTAESLNDAIPAGPPSEVQMIALPGVVDTQRVDRNSSSEPAQFSCNSDFDDSGYQSSHEENFSRDQATASKITGTAASSSSAEYAIPQTPQKAAKPAPTDSGISLSFESSDEPQTQPVRYSDGSESPLAGKASRAKPVEAGPPFSRPVPTPVQPSSLPIRTKGNFASFGDPSSKLRNYIKQPLVEKLDMKEGYIYGFQLEGCAYTKIGYSAARDTESSLEASFDARMKEHKVAGWSDLKVVLKKRVPHVHRIEKIIHYHLEAGRMKEQCSCKGFNGRKYGHGNHTEWFNNSLDEIYTVVLAWKYWILSVPYAEPYDGKLHLSSQWRSYLEDIRIQGGRDYWLDWLCEHVPQLPRLIHRTTLDTSEWIENERKAEGHGSFSRDNATGIKFQINRVKTCL